MKRSTIAVLAALISLIGPARALAGTEFLAYEGRNAIHEGQGGEKKTVEGIDFWFNGDPPHRFQVLGAISDRRMKTGLYGLIRMSGLDSDIAKTAKAAGGDAVILQNEGEDVLGVSGFGSAYATGGNGFASAFGSSFSAPVEAHVARYIVVRYLPDDPAAVPTGPPSPAPVAGAPVAAPPGPPSH